MINDSKQNIPSGIQVTKNYNLFSYVRGNRNIKNRHLIDLTISIGKDNMLAQNPILVNEKMEVIDGQHRLEVARNNNLDVYYLVLPGATIEQVVQLNANAKSWDAYDYIESYATRGYQGYVWLTQFMEDYQLKITQVMLFVYGSDVRWVAHKIRHGEFDPTEEMKDKAIARADILYELRPFIKKVGTIPRAIIQGIIDIEEEGLGRSLVDNVKANGRPFVPETLRKESLRQLRSMAKTK